MILTVTLNPCVDTTLFVEGLKPYDTNRVTRADRDAGGKGVNLSRVAAELGGETLATGFLGGTTGAYVRSVLDAEGVPHDFVELQGETRHNFSIEDGTGNPPTTLNERGIPVSQSDLDNVWTKVSVVPAQWVCAGGSLPPGTDSSVYGDLTERARASGAKVLIDADGPALRQALTHGPDLIKPNADEASRLLGHPLADADAALTAAQHLSQQLVEAGSREAMVIISLGADGAVLASPVGCWVGESPHVKPQSTIGSGDSLLGGFLWALCQGMELPEALRWGMAAGAATATTSGAEIARLPVIEQLLPMARVSAAS